MSQSKTKIRRRFYKQRRRAQRIATQVAVLAKADPPMVVPSRFKLLRFILGR